MPKKDNFSEHKKDGDKAKKKLAEQKAKDAKLAKEAAAEAAQEELQGGPGSTTTAPRANIKLASGSSFAKAAATAVADEEEEVAAEDYDYDYDYDTEETTATTSSTTSAKAQAKKETAADQKKKAKQLKKDEFAMLAEQEKLAKRERIKQRFLRLILVGVILDLFKGDETASGKDAKKAPAPKDKKPKKAGKVEEREGKSFKELMDMYSGPFMVLVVLAAVIYGKAMEDTWTPGVDQDVNFYDVMGVPHDASLMDIRKKYKSLALTWHPDKNPDCEACPEKFAAISKAYETLSDVESKKAYDSRSVAKETLSSQTVDLTADDFEAKVLRANEVWYVQVFDPTDQGPSHSFHPIWEEVSSKYADVAKFGRIDMSKQKRALNLLPMRVVITPVVFRFARGHDSENWMWQGTSEESGSAPLARFIVDTYPTLHKMENAGEVSTWWSRSDRSRLLISGNGAVIRRGVSNSQFFKVLREAFAWADFFYVSAADGKDAAEGLKDVDVTLPQASKKGHPWSVVYIPAGETKAKAQIASTEDIKEFPDKIEEIVQKAIATEAPPLTVRNHRQLCGAGTASRTFCLILVDMTSTASVAKVIEDVASSRSDYAKELQEIQESEDGGNPQEEAFRIQPVRVMTGTSRFPSQPVAVGSDFHTAWAQVGYSPMFLIEIDSGRVAPVKQSILPQLCQQIAYEDIKFKELPDSFHILRALPDPEVPLRRALIRKLSSPVGAILALLFLATVGAVAPELEVAHLAAGGGAALSIIVLAWPLACRRLLSFGTRM